MKTSIRYSIETIFQFLIRRRKVIISVVFIFLLFFVFYIRQRGEFDAHYLITFLQDNPIIAPLLFFVLYVLTIIFIVPSLPLNFIAGFLWGPWWGGLLALASAVFGAATSFLLARYLGADIITGFLRNSKWEEIQKRLEHHHWKIVAATRIIPGMPFGIINYLFGITSVSFRTYFWVSTVALIPGTLAFSAIGSSLGEAALESNTSIVINRIFIAFLIMGGLFVLQYFARKYFKKDAKSNSKS